VTGGGRGQNSIAPGYWPLRFARPATENRSVLVPDAPPTDDPVDQRVLHLRWHLRIADRRPVRRPPAPLVWDCVGTPRSDDAQMEGLRARHPMREGELDSASPDGHCLNGRSDCWRTGTGLRCSALQKRYPLLGGESGLAVPRAMGRVAASPVAFTPSS